MQKPTVKLGATALWAALALTGFAAAAMLNFPGHVPLDSLSALWEGRNHVRMTWGPIVYSAVLGLFDSVSRGTGLYLLCSLALLFGAWALLPAVRPLRSWLSVALLAVLLVTPEVLVWQGMVLRDVLCANLAVAGFVGLALAEAHWGAARIRWPALAVAALSLAVAALVRQNAGVVILPAALALGWAAHRGGERWPIAWSGGGLAVAAGLAVALHAAAPIHDPPKVHYNIGPRLLEHYDLLGALAADPQRPMPDMQADRPDKLQVLRAQGPAAYSAVRIDTIDQHPEAGKALWRFKRQSIEAQWAHVLLSDPAGYLGRRLEVFRWVFLTPDLPRCGPVFTGVSGIPAIERQLGLPERRTARDAKLAAYAMTWTRTPLYSHLTYAVLAVAVGGFLLWRREPGDGAMAALLAGALLFTASFFVISIACDYRYLYMLDLAAMSGCLYAALDLRRRA